MIQNQCNSPWHRDERGVYYLLKLRLVQQTNFGSFSYHFTHYIIISRISHTNYTIATHNPFGPIVFDEQQLLSHFDSTKEKQKDEKERNMTEYEVPSERRKRTFLVDEFRRKFHPPTLIWSVKGNYLFYTWDFIISLSLFCNCANEAYEWARLFIFILCFILIAYIYFVWMLNQIITSRIPWLLIDFSQFTHQIGIRTNWIWTICQLFKFQSRQYSYQIFNSKLLF